MGGRQITSRLISGDVSYTWSKTVIMGEDGDNGEEMSRRTRPS